MYQRVIGTLAEIDHPHRNVVAFAQPQSRQDVNRLLAYAGQLPLALEVPDQELLELAAAKHNGLTFRVVPTRPPDHN